MSVAVWRGPSVPAFQMPSWRPAEPRKPAAVVDDRPAQVDIWSAIQANVHKAAVTKTKASKPYVDPHARRSSFLMSQTSLELCTESLGSETGSGDFTDMACLFVNSTPVEAEESLESAAQDEDCALDENWERKELAAVDYHCSGRMRSPRRSFPPPLPSMSTSDGSCVQMRSRRQDGRLVVEAVAVRQRGYLHATRHGGRLRLSFVECSAREQTAAAMEEKNEAAMEVEEEDEEEVEVVERGTVVEVKVSTQPQTHASGKVHRSTLVINKFVGSTPFASFDHPRLLADAPPRSEAAARDETARAAPRLRRVPSSTTTLTAAVAVASIETAGSTPDDGDGDECGGLHAPAADAKQLLLFTSRSRDKHGLLQSVRRCRQLRQKPLFILEPYCIATS